MGSFGWFNGLCGSVNGLCFLCGLCGFVLFYLTGMFEVFRAPVFFAVFEWACGLGCFNGRGCLWFCFVGLYGSGCFRRFDAFVICYGIVEFAPCNGLGGLL